MLEIILLILKIIGIILLVILGLVFLILFLVLFAPIKYKSNGYKRDKDFALQAVVTYLNPLVSITVKYPEETVVHVKILGITVYTQRVKKGVADDEAGAEDIKNNRIGEEKSDNSDNYQHTDDCVKAAEEHKEESQKVSSESKYKKETENAEKAKASKETGQSEEAPASKIQNSSKKKNSTLNTVGYYASMLQENKGLILEVLKTVLKALKTILPRKCYIKAILGTGQADTTGYIYALYCAVLDYLPKRIEIILEPVWTQKSLEGEYSVKGKIRLIHILIATIKIVADKNVRQLYKRIRSV